MQLRLRSRVNNRDILEERCSKTVVNILIGIEISGSLMGLVNAQNKHYIGPLYRILDGYRNKKQFGGAEKLLCWR